MGLEKGKSIFDPTDLPNSDTVGSYTTDAAGNLITSQANGSQRALDIGIDVAGVQIDPRQVRAITAATDSIQAASQKGSLVDHSGTTSAVSNTSTQIMAVNSNRKYLFIQNVHGSNTFWINFTIAANANQPSLKMGPGSSFTMEGSFVSTETINIFSSNTSVPFVAKEG